MFVRLGTGTKQLPSPTSRSQQHIVATALKALYSLGERDFTGAVLDKAELRGVDLPGVVLADADMTMSSLSGADLSGANLMGAKLRSADLSDSILCKAFLDSTDLAESDLQGANLREANLTSTNLTNARLDRADFHSASAGHTIWAGNDLRAVKNLEHVRHTRPSILSIDTIYLSEGKIPEPFLRGCGVPDSLIVYIGSLVGRAIEYYSCFISYSHQDEEFTKRLHARMQQEGLRVWFAREDVKGGAKIHEQIDEAIRLHDKVLLVLSPHSMRSEWVATEIYKARRREQRENRRMLFPITLVPFDAVRDWESFDADTGKDQAREIREYYIPDFSGWKEQDAFEAAFARLLKDLRAQSLAPIRPPE